MQSRTNLFSNPSSTVIVNINILDQLASENKSASALNESSRASAMTAPDDSSSATESSKGEPISYTTPQIGTENISTHKHNYDMAQTNFTGESASTVAAIQTQETTPTPSSRKSGKGGRSGYDMTGVLNPNRGEPRQLGTSRGGGTMSMEDFQRCQSEEEAWKLYSESYLLRVNSQPQHDTQWLPQ